jgi:hypothetical protein
MSEADELHGGDKDAPPDWSHRGADCCSGSVAVGSVAAETAGASASQSSGYLSARARRNPGLSAAELEAAEAEAAEWARVSNCC